jgi:uncharacterized protein YjbJ (UPF0337 family)
MVLAALDQERRTSMGRLKREAAEQEVKGLGQRAKGLGQEIVGRATGDDSLRARGVANQAAGTIRNAAGEAGRRITGAVEREGSRSRSRRRG